jgi:hypothetical protein
MAQRRMFSQRIVGDENFLEMPSSSQNLYFHLGVYADDDGFVNPQKIIRMIGANPDDLKVIITKGFVIPFKNGVVVITNWKENNYIQADRYTPTIYQEQYKELECTQNVYKLDTQVRLGKVRLGKVRLGKVSNIHREQVPEGINHLISLFKEVNPSYKNFFANTTQRAALERMVKEHGLEKVTGLLEGLPEIVNRPYAPKITTPIQLEQRLGELMIFISQEQSKKRGGVVDARTK